MDKIAEIETPFPDVKVALFDRSETHENVPYVICATKNDKPMLEWGVEGVVSCRNPDILLQQVLQRMVKIMMF